MGRERSTDVASAASSGATRFEHVFRPGRIGTLDLPHRIIMGSMHLGLESDPDPLALAAFYVERVRGEAALIITGGSSVSRVGAGGRHYSFINEPADHAKLEPIAAAVRGAGGRIALQLFHAGRYASQRDFGLQPLAPSAIASRFSKSPPRALTAQEITGTIEDFARGARNARALGFDAVEIMGSEGYLLNQFLSPLTNRRDDEWGGDFERRTRLPLAVLRAVRAASGPDFPIIYRASAADLMNGSTSREETCAFVRLLAENGADAIEAGVGWHESSTPTVQYTVAPAAWAQEAEAIARAAPSIPVIASTRINTVELAEDVLARGRVSFVAMARPFLADPHIIAKSRSGRTRSTNVCIACNQACIDRSLRDQRVSCMVNPRAGSERILTEAPVRPNARGSFAVVGAGPAGLEAARVFGALGHHAVLYESGARLGGQFHLASCIPGKRDYGRTIEYFARELQRLGVEIRLGQRISPESATLLESYDGIVVATGVVPRRITLPGTDLPLVHEYPGAILASAHGGAAGRETPVAIIGAGGVGVDVAHLFASRGHPVTLMCRGGAIAERIGRSTRWVLVRELRARGVEILTGVCYERIDSDGVWIVIGDREHRHVDARLVVIAAGQEPNDPLTETLKRRGSRVRVVGGARLATELDAVRAFREGALAAHALAEASKSEGRSRPNDASG